MAELAYREVYTMNLIETRKLLIKTYHQTKSIRKTARIWKTSRNMVANGSAASRPKERRGLRTSPADPHLSPRQTPPAIEQIQ